MAEPNPPPSPWSPDARHIFVVFNRLALQGFGGVLAVAQRELVERERWLGREEFLRLLTLGQLLPGPNIVNRALIGALLVGRWRLGWRGATAALTGLLGAPLVIVLLLAALYRQPMAHPVVAGALRGMGAVAAGWILTEPVRASIGAMLLLPFTALMLLRTKIGPMWLVAGGALGGALGGAG